VEREKMEADIENRLEKFAKMVRMRTSAVQG
jgi:hypothetical protein